MAELGGEKGESEHGELGKIDGILTHEVGAGSLVEMENLGPAPGEILSKSEAVVSTTGSPVVDQNRATKENSLSTCSAAQELTMNEASAKSVVLGGSGAGQNGDNDDREEGEVTPIQAPCILVGQTEELAQ